MTRNEGAGNSGPSSVPVLIAGGGPVGLALAAELGTRGIGCLLVEKRDGSVPVPKMSAVSVRNMEFCRRWGIADAVRDAVWAGSNALDFVYVRDLVGEELARVKVPPTSRRGEWGFTPESTCHCPQIYFDPILSAFVRSLPSVELRCLTSLDSFTQDESGVSARLVDQRTGRSAEVSAAYLVGCDGPGGVVREELGIGLGGLGVVANSINIFFRSPALASLHDKGWARFYRTIDETGCWGELIAIDGKELWRLTVFDDPTGDADPDECLRRAVGTAFPYEMISVLNWERRDYVADHYGRGRVFIAGDTAHQCSPTGGLGMHTGMEEAVNLGWKLAAMVEGWGGDGLLASYEIERRPLASRNVALATCAYRQITGIPPFDAREPKSEAAARAEQVAVWRSRLALDRFSVSEFVKTQYCYEDSPICVSDGSPPPDDAGPGFVPSARPGTRAPHAWIGEGRSTLDLFGDGFTLLALGEAPPDGASLADAAARRGVPLRGVALADPAVLAIYERPLVLVRPDGHVAWRGDRCPADPLAVIDRVRGAA